MSYVWGVIDQKIGTKRAVMVFALLWTVMMALSAVGSGLNSLSVSIISVVFLSCLHGGMANLDALPHYPNLRPVRLRPGQQTHYSHRGRHPAVHR